MASSDPLNLTGATLAKRYSIDSLVRVEWSTAVYRATHIASNHSVAVRVLAGVASLSEARRDALSDQLAHHYVTLTELSEIIPAAYPLRDIGTVRTPRGNVPFVVLDWPHGVTLRHLMLPEAGSTPQLPESIDDVVVLLEPIAVALAIAHEHGVVHGGLTADRVLFREDGSDGTRRAALLDFGVAFVLHAVETEHEATSADDVRALASLVAQVMARACGADARFDDARTPRARGVAVTDEVERVFLRAISADTYETVGDLWSALRRALGLTELRSLQVTIPPESRPISSTSLHPLSRSAAPGASRTLRDAIFYGLGAFALLVTGGLTLERVFFEGAKAPMRAASTTPSASPRPSCPSGMIAEGGTVARLGSAEDADDPPRDVTLGPFCIDKESVTAKAYNACSGRGECAPASATNSWIGISADDHQVLDAFCTARDPDSESSRPVNCVSWEMAETYCAKRGARLPTEAEAELAWRSTSAAVAEWVSDWRAPITPEARVDPSGPSSGNERVVRGAHAGGTRPTRFGAEPTTKSHAIGFRCVTRP